MIEISEDQKKGLLRAKMELERRQMEVQNAELRLQNMILFIMAEHGMNPNEYVFNTETMTFNQKKKEAEIDGKQSSSDISC